MNTISAAVSIVRRMCALMALSLLIVPTFASAQTTAELWQTRFLTKWFSTPDAACAAIVGKNGITYAVVEAAGSAGYNCKYFQTPDNQYFTTPISRRVLTCTAGIDYENGVCLSAPTSCAGYTQGANATANAVLAAKGWRGMVDPIACTVAGNGMATCSGAMSPGGRTVSTTIECWGAGGGSTGAGPSPLPKGDPPPDVEVDYPRCPQGQYRYYDVDGSNWCTVPLVEKDKTNAPQCDSGNVGAVNGQMVCLPANPGPASAKQGAQSALTNADQAKASAGTTAATDAARRAAAAAQQAVDAAESLLPDDPKKAQAVQDAKNAIDAAQRAAGYAGRPYAGPTDVGGGGGTGGGGGGGTFESCGLPGKPKCQIDETGTPTKTSADLDELVKPAKNANDDFVAKIDSINETSTGANTSWFPQFPTAACEDPTVPGLNGGAAVSVPICGAVETFSNFIAGVFAFFSIMGGVGVIQSAMRA